MQQISLVSAQYAERRKVRANSDCADLWAVLDQVFDPELPQVTIWDLGILIDVTATANQGCNVVVTPTYSGCPAIDVISQDITAALLKAGVQTVTVDVSLSPAWHTELLSPQGRAALLRQGIAPPTDEVLCPQCDSAEVALISQFGSTACKALYRCNSCLEPFDYFKKF